MDRDCELPVSELNKCAQYVYQLLEPAKSEDAWHSLVEAGKRVVPFLIRMYRATPEPTIRAQLVSVINQHRLPETIDFLAEALIETPQVWKNALDGFVTIGGPKAIAALEAAKQRFRPDHQADAEEIAWIDEAIQQIRDEESQP